MSVASDHSLDVHDAANASTPGGSACRSFCGAPDVAEQLLREIVEVPDQATEAEVVAYQALVLALRGDDSALPLCEQARSLTPTIEAGVVSRFAEALLAVHDGRVEPLLVGHAPQRRPGYATLRLLVSCSSWTFERRPPRLATPRQRHLYARRRPQKARQRVMARRAAIESRAGGLRTPLDRALESRDRKGAVHQPGHCESPR